MVELATGRDTPVVGEVERRRAARERRTSEE